MRTFQIQGCWANPDGADSDDFLGKNLKLIFVIYSTFYQILTAQTEFDCVEIILNVLELFIVSIAIELWK